MTTDSLLIASNRGPVSWRETEDGPVASRGFGGLVTALGGALQDEPGTWTSVAMSDADREVAARHPGRPFDVEVDGNHFRVRLIDAGQRFEPYYNEVSNRLLWFTVHGMWNPPYEPSGPWSSAWRDAYAQVNRDVAAGLADAGGQRPEVHLHDYHLTTVARELRKSLPDAPILHYIHTPWPMPAELKLLPDEIVDGVLDGLLHADVVVLSAPLWSRALRDCAAEIAGGDVDGETVVRNGRRTLVTDLVLGVDASTLAESAASEETREAWRRLDERVADRVLVARVDRSDLSKNILRGLHAYELLLERHEELRGKVWHYAHLNPTRQGVPEYRAYLDACQEAVDRIRGRFGDDAVDMYVGDDYPGALAALQRYDVLLANPVRDGTNLVAKEGPVLNERDGAVVLSREAGATTVLGEAALSVNPFDVEEQAAALHAAITMNAGERKQRASALREAAMLGSPEEWFAAQRSLLRQAVAAR